MSAFESFAAAVQSHGPSAAVVLGSGLGAAPHRFEELATISFADIPGLVAPSVHGHRGKIDLGVCGGVPLLVFRGRLHCYEGHSRDHVARPIRVASTLGIKVLLLTNAAGGIHESLGPGDLMVLRGHLLLQKPVSATEVSRRCDCLRGLEADTTSPPYSERLVKLLQRIECEHGRQLRAGVYAAVTGPCYETPAEIRALRAMGADAVGMSTAFEAEAAWELGMEVAAISCITNKAAGLAEGVLDHREVLANASKPAERISKLLVTFLSQSG